MSYLRITSLVMTLVGILLVVATFVLDLTPMWQLAGIMLILAGIVKVAVVTIWTRVATMDDPTPSP